MYEVLPFSWELLFLPSAVSRRRTNGVIYSVAIRLMSSIRQEIRNVRPCLDIAQVRG